MSLQEYIQLLSTGRRFKSNILSPLAWGGALAIPFCFYGLFVIANTPIQCFCASIILVFIIYYARQYEYWKKTDPDRLQSEWLTLQKLQATMRIQGKQPELIEDMDIVTPPRRLTKEGKDG
jgi:hypothetical protein